MVVCTAEDDIVSPPCDSFSPKHFEASDVIILIICLSAKIQALVYSSFDSLMIFFRASNRSGIVKIYFSNFGSIDIIDNTSCRQKTREFVKRLYLAYGLILFSIPSLVASAINTAHALAIVVLLVPIACKSEIDLQRSFLPIYTAPSGADLMHAPIPSPSPFPDSCHEIPDAIF